jgi:hypothetical protein
MHLSRVRHQSLEVKRHRGTSFWRHEYQDLEATGMRGCGRAYHHTEEVKILNMMVRKAIADATRKCVDEAVEARRGVEFVQGLHIVKSTSMWEWPYHRTGGVGLMVAKTIADATRKISIDKVVEESNSLDCGISFSFTIKEQSVIMRGEQGQFAPVYSGQTRMFKFATIVRCACYDQNGFR